MESFNEIWELYHNWTIEDNSIIYLRFIYQWILMKLINAQSGHKTVDLTKISVSESRHQFICCLPIQGHIKKYLTQHIMLKLPRQTQSMTAYVIFIEHFWEIQSKTCIVAMLEKFSIILTRNTIFQSAECELIDDDTLQREEQLLVHQTWWLLSYCHSRHRLVWFYQTDITAIYNKYISCSSYVVWQAVVYDLPLIQKLEIIHEVG